MKIIKALSIFVIVAIILGLVAVKFTIRHVPIGHVGVKINEYSMFTTKGVVTKDFNPGWHMDIGPIHSWVLFDKTVQTLEMTRDPSQGNRKGRDDVQVQSADGYAVSVDITVKYRIQDGKAHKILVDTGSGIKYQSIVRNESQKACMARFGQMRTEDFYDPHKRREVAKQIKETLAASLENNFVEVIDTLIRDVQFDPGYEAKIRRKKLADQEVELNKSKSKALTMTGKREVTEAQTAKHLIVIKQEKESKLVTMTAEMNREIAKIVADYERYATEKQADADVIAAKKDAEGDLLIKQAEAEGEELRNNAMQGVGGSTIVALEAARNLNLSDLVISTAAVDFLDIDSMATKLGVKEETKATEK